jgi:hypothetical protein
LKSGLNTPHDAVGRDVGGKSESHRAEEGASGDGGFEVSRLVESLVDLFRTVAAFSVCISG